MEAFCFLGRNCANLDDTEAARLAAVLLFVSREGLLRRDFRRKQRMQSTGKSVTFRVLRPTFEAER
jgi:hypothetical protein